jgi:hypothetical protein
MKQFCVLKYWSLAISLADVAYELRKVTRAYLCMGTASYFKLGIYLWDSHR